MKYTYISVRIIQPSAQCSFHLKMHFLLTLLSRFISHWDLSKGLESFINASNTAHLTAVVRKGRGIAFHQILKWRLYIKYSLILPPGVYGRQFVSARSPSIHRRLATLNNTAILLCVLGPPVKRNTTPPAAHENPGVMTSEGLCAWSFLLVPFPCCCD